jgi:sec-independent protein translocase protein TatC
MIQRPGLETMMRFLAGLRPILVKTILSAFLLAAAVFYFSRALILALVHHLHVQLYYFDISEVFFSSVELSIYAGIFLSVPVIVVLAWRRFWPAGKSKGLRGYPFVIFSILLFYLGSVFCYLVVLPSGVAFLMSYQGGPLRAMLSTEYFVRFAVAMVFAFGAAFELPVLILLAGKLGFVASRTLSRTRRYAALVIVIAASVITPTPDIYNMSLLAVPLYVLYEIGILLLKLQERSLTPKANSV